MLANIEITFEEIVDNSHLVEARVVERPATPEPELWMQKRYTTEEMRVQWEKTLQESRMTLPSQIKELE